LKQLMKFSQPSCTPCKSLSKYLEDKGVKYQEVDVFEDAHIAVKYGIMGGLPVVILLDGEDVVDRTSGFNPSFTDPIDRLIEQL
jgi:thioredoxin 1